VDNCVERFIAGHLDAVTAAMAKYCLTDCQCRIVDECVQLHGGYGRRLLSVEVLFLGTSRENAILDPASCPSCAVCATCSMML